MLKGLNLNELAAKITANRELKRDYIAAANKLEMGVDSDGTTKLLVPEQGTFPVLPVAHRQLGTYTQIPAPYYDRMKTDAPDLLAKNVNVWLGKQQPLSKRMVRTLGGDTRALLSNSYQRIENEEIAAVALPVLHDLPNVEIVSAEVTDKRLYIHFVVPGIAGEVKVGDVVQAGGIISNSEVGLGSISVAGLVWRLLCLNGAKTTDAFRRAHVGRRIEDDSELWADDTKKADDKAVLLKVRDMVKGVVDETRFRVQLDKMRDLAGAKIGLGNITESVGAVTKLLALPEHHGASILESLAAGGDLTAWGLVNAVTAQAHKAACYDDAVAMEAAGGNLLSLPAGEWKRILEAA